MPRGGKRTGTPGKEYGNRTDLNANRGAPLPATAPTGQAYGARAGQIAAQKSLPMSPPMPPPAPTAPTSGPPPGARPTLENPNVPPPAPIDAPTARPDEPLTTGIPMGSGAGPEVLPSPYLYGDDPAIQIRALFTQYPNNRDLARLISQIDGG